MTVSRALSIVLELARKSALPVNEANPRLTKEMWEQQEAMRLVDAMIRRGRGGVRWQ